MFFNYFFEVVVHCVHAGAKYINEQHRKAAMYSADQMACVTLYISIADNLQYTVFINLGEVSRLSHSVFIQKKKTLNIPGTAVQWFPAKAPLCSVTLLVLPKVRNLRHAKKGCLEQFSTPQNCKATVKPLSRNT